MQSSKLCECGCGEYTERSDITREARGWKKGEGKRFLAGHHKRKALRAVICSYCSKEYKVKECLLKTTKYCSKSCQTSANNIRRAHPEGHITMWDGYKAIKVSDHPKANISGLIMYHNYLMEQHLGKEIPEGFIVHHIDDNKLNNEITNLVLVTPSVHGKIHSTDKRKGLRKYHADRRSNC